MRFPLANPLCRRDGVLANHGLVRSDSESRFLPKDRLQRTRLLVFRQHRRLSRGNVLSNARAIAQALGLTNLEARTADVYALPFGDGAFDAIYMITVIGELPELGRALGEFHRVLKPGGTVAFSEIVLDPDYPLARTLIRKAAEAGLRLKKRVGGGFSYTLVFEKPRAT